MKAQLLFLCLFIITFILGCTQEDSFVEKNSEPVLGCCTPMCIPSSQEECKGDFINASCSSVDDCKISCCDPVCEEITKITCEQSGGLATGMTCSEVDNCKISCCDPICKETTKVYCEQVGGLATGVTCSEVDECEMGCCAPFCVETTKAMCGQEHGYGGRWTQGSCASVSECNNVCCGPTNTMMTKTMCNQTDGTEVSESLCAGKGSITIEMPHVISCTCNDGTDPKNTCEESMNLVQSFTASLVPDPDAPSDNFMTSWLYDEKNYYFKGSGTYVMSGTREISQLYENTVTCYGPGVPPGTKAIVSTISTSDFTYAASNTANITAQITKRGDGTYAISFTSPQTWGTEKEVWTRKTENGCPTESPSSESETYDSEIEGIIIAASLDNVTTLNGFKTFTQYPPEGAFACEGRNNTGTGIIRWSFTLPE